MLGLWLDRTFAPRQEAYADAKLNQDSFGLGTLCFTREVHFMAEELITLYSTSRIETAATNNISLERSGPDTLKREQSNSGRHKTADNERRVGFHDSVYNVAEEDVYAARVESDISEDIFSAVCASAEPDSSKVFDYSHVHFATNISSPEIPGFCLDIVATRSVIGKKAQHTILNQVRRSQVPIVLSANKF